MTMPTWVHKFLEVARRITQDRGPMTLCALVLREDTYAVASTSDAGITQRWQWLVAADWLSPANEKQDLRYLVEIYREMVGVAALMRIARLELLPVNDPVVLELNAHADPRGEVTQIATSFLLGDVRIRQVILFNPSVQSANVTTTLGSHS